MSLCFRSQQQQILPEGRLRVAGFPLLADSLLPWLLLARGI
jgi:hypothetical protein